jgi:hypothetical protein
MIENVLIRENENILIRNENDENKIYNDRNNLRERNKMISVYRKNKIVV